MSSGRGRASKTGARNGKGNPRDEDGQTINKWAVATQAIELDSFHASEFWKSYKVNDRFWIVKEADEHCWYADKEGAHSLKSKKVSKSDVKFEQSDGESNGAAMPHNSAASSAADELLRGAGTDSSGAATGADGAFSTRREIHSQTGVKRAPAAGAPANQKKSKPEGAEGDTLSNAPVVDDDSEAEGAERSLDAAAPRHMHSEVSLSSGGGGSAATAALSGARDETKASVEETAYSMLKTLFDDNRLSYDVCQKVRFHFNVKCIEDLSYLEDRDIAKLELPLVDCRKLEKLVQEVRSPSFKKPAKEALPHAEMPGNVDAEIPDSVRPKALLRARFGDGRRVALCIGIDDYPGNQRLQNCVADAEDMRNCCEHQLGFHVARVLTNPNRRDILQALRELREVMEDGSLVFFFFSGHGVEHEGVNYLLPLGMESTRVEDHEDQAVSLDLIMNKFRKGTAVDCNIVNVMLLDCCRENADTKTFKSTKGGESASGFGKSITKSLRSTSTNAEFLVGLACDPGTQALANDDARNSRYTEALLKHLPVTGRQLEESMKEVSKDVYNKTQKRQRPWTHNCLHQSVVLVPR